MSPRDHSEKKGKRADIEALFAELLISDKVITVIVTSAEGLPVASGKPTELFPEAMLSALTATLMATTEQMGQQMGLGNSRSLKVELDLGILLMREIRERVSLGLILEQDSNLAYYEVTMEKLVREIDAILFPDLQE
ncbi:MAG TPA: roadblock/LC7 domain-containing protein [Candidatus Lokiarchaeia archaeon]|nr:roadblock/LC7 domain-containing protein [Candidatus Lokiarchaeia archaeon]